MYKPDETPLGGLPERIRGCLGMSWCGHIKAGLTDVNGKLVDYLFMLF